MSIPKRPARVQPAKRIRRRHPDHASGFHFAFALLNALVGKAGRVSVVYLAGLLFLLMGVAEAQPLKNWAGTGSVRYWENTAATTTENAGPNGEACTTLGDNVCIGTVYARSATRRPESFWRHWVETGDVSYWTEAAETARDWGVLLKIRTPPMLVWSNKGWPPGIASWGRGWIDTDDADTMRRYEEWILAVRQAVESVWPHTIYDASPPGEVGEPRFDQVPIPDRPDYQRHTDNLTRLYGGAYGIERMVVFLYSSTYQHPEGGDYGHDYLDAVGALGMPAAARQDGYGSGSKYQEYDAVRTHTLGAHLLAACPAFYEQWGGSIQDWWTDPVVTSIGTPAVHYDMGASRYNATSIAHMGWSVRAGPHAEENVAAYRAFWLRTMQYAPAQIETMVARLDGGGGPPPPTSGDTWRIQVEGEQGAWVYGLAVTESDVDSGIYRQREHFPWLGGRDTDVPQTVRIGFIAVRERDGENIAISSEPATQLMLHDAGSEGLAVFRFVLREDVRFTVRYEEESGGSTIVELIAQVEAQQAEIEALQAEVLALGAGLLGAQEARAALQSELANLLVRVRRAGAILEE